MGGEVGVGKKEETESLILLLVVLGLLEGSWWLRESYLGLAGNTYFVYLALKT